MMDKMVFNSPEEVKAGMNTGDKQRDLEVIYSLLSGNVEIANTPNQELSEPTEVDTPVETNDENIPIVQSSYSPVQDELEKERAYKELLEQQHREEQERYLSELKKSQELLDKEKKAREELEKRLQMQEELKRVETRTESVIAGEDSEDEYVSDYAKRTRELVEQLKSSVEQDLPTKVKESLERLERIESEYERERDEKRKTLEEDKVKREEEKLFDNIRRFQKAVPEFSTTVDIKNIDDEYRRFRKDIAFISKARNIPELEQAIQDYYNNGTTRELAEKNGIKEVPDYEKYTAIAELMDIKNGVQYDPITGEEKPILDEFGNSVRYRSLEEAYRIKNYYKEIENARKQSVREVAKKIDQFNNAPVTLNNTQTDVFSTGFSPEQERQLLNTRPEDWAKDPELRKKVELVYNKRGMTLPTYKGRRF